MLNVKKMMYDQHVRSAWNRKIDFKFTFVEWIDWWEAQLGDDWAERRGLRKGQYVMARKRDRGPYAAWNVSCVTVGENSSEANRGRRKYGPRLTKTDVLKIFKSEKPNSELAKEYKTTTGLIGRIKRKSTWAHLTKGLVSPPRLKGVRGEKMWASLLTAEKVIAIRKSTKCRRELAVLYGVSYNTITNVITRKAWKHVP